MKPINQIINEMTFPELAAFQRELHFAYVWHTEGYESAYMSSMVNLNQSDISHGFGNQYTHKERQNEIAKSQLYNFARDELRKRIPGASANVGNLWIGWFAPKSLNEGQDIRRHIGNIFRNRYPVYGSTGGGVTLEEAEKAREALKNSHGLNGVFLGNESLDDLFMKNYAPKN